MVKNHPKPKKTIFKMYEIEKTHLKEYGTEVKK